MEDISKIYQMSLLGIVMLDPRRCSGGSHVISSNNYYRESVRKKTLQLDFTMLAATGIPIWNYK